jgi:hypothetical protein
MFIILRHVPNSDLLQIYILDWSKRNRLFASLTASGVIMALSVTHFRIIIPEILVVDGRNIVRSLATGSEDGL